MADLVFLLIILAPGLLLAAHLTSLGSPYVKEHWSNGAMRYEVWIRRLGGFNDLAGEYTNEEDANRLVGRILEKSRTQS